MSSFASNLIFPSTSRSVGEFFQAAGKGFIKVGETSSGSYLRAQFLRTIGLAKSKPRCFDSQSISYDMLDKPEYTGWSHRVDCKTYDKGKTFEHRVEIQSPRGTIKRDIISDCRLKLSLDLRKKNDSFVPYISLAKLPSPQENASLDQAKNASAKKDNNRWKDFFRLPNKFSFRTKKSNASPIEELRCSLDNGLKDKENPFSDRMSSILVDGETVPVYHRKLKAPELAIKSPWAAPVPKDQTHIQVEGVQVQIPLGATLVNRESDGVIFYSLYEPKPHAQSTLAATKM